MTGIRPGSLRAAVQPFIKSAALQGLSRRQTEALLRERFGRAPAHQSVLADLRYYKDLPRRANAASSTRLDRRIGEDVHAPTAMRRGEYRYVVGVDRIPRDGSPTLREIVTLVYDRRPTRGQILQAARDVGMTYGHRKQYDAGDAEILELYVRA